MRLRVLVARRQCLKLVALALTCGGIGIEGSCALDSRDPEPVHRLLALLDEACDARTIGHACLTVLPPHERSAAFLVQAITADASLDLRTDGRLDVQRLVRGQVRREFAQGTVVAVDGWFLARTEVRLYALAALA